MNGAPWRRVALLPMLACVLAAFLWALNALMAKGAFDRGLSPGEVAQGRALVAVVPLATWLVTARRDLLRPPPGTLLLLVAFGLSLAGVSFTYFLAIDRITVGVAIALQYTAPALVLLATALLSRRRPPPSAWLASLLTLAGAILVSGALGGLARADSVGLIAGVGAAVTFAVYLVSAGAAGRRGAHPATSLFIGFGVALVAWSIIQPWWAWPWGSLGDPEVSLRLLGVGILGTLVPFGLVVAALRVLPPALAGIAATSEPVFAAGLAWLYLNERLEPVQLLGGALVVVGVVVAQLAAAPVPHLASSRSRRADCMQRAAGGEPMESDRTRDSVEQLEDRKLPNPITDRGAELTEPGEGFEPGADREPDDPEQEGPPAHTTQMPR